MTVTGCANLSALSTPATQLVATVRNPQDRSILARVEQILAPSAQQFSFQIPLEIAHTSHYFISGEISLLSSSNESLASDSFTIALDRSAAYDNTALDPLDTQEEYHSPNDPFATAFHIALRKQESQSAVNPSATAAQLEKFMAASDLEIAKLDIGELPLHSYDINSYEVVVED